MAARENVERLVDAFHDVTFPPGSSRRVQLGAIDEIKLRATAFGFTFRGFANGVSIDKDITREELNLDSRFFWPDAGPSPR